MCLLKGNNLIKVLSSCLIANGLLRLLNRMVAIPAPFSEFSAGFLFSIIILCAVLLLASKRRQTS